MTSFIIALVALIAGYFIYGGLVERVFKTDPNRPTPATTMADGIDYVAMPTWKVYLIQFLNIAGVGPIFGAIMGIMYGPAAFLWIVLGTIFAGAVHDFMSGMISLRLGGKSLPEIVGSELGKKIKIVMSVFTCVLLVMVIAVFVRTPANLLGTLTPEHLNATFWASCIFLYYILATLLPVDKLIGNLYPLFGFALLFMAVGIMGYMIVNGVQIPDGFSDGLFSRHPAGEDAPIFPMMCISIACGAISGFHATQSPMMARCLQNEKHGRMVFYGAMVSEGIVALIWAAAAIAFTGGYDKLAGYMASHGQDAGILVHEVCVQWLGTFGGILAILGVIAAPITTGDTAMRSLRLIIADAIGLSQKKFVKRLLVTLPIVGLSYLLLNVNFDVLWRYFAWCNQTLSIFTLWACSVYLARNNSTSMAYLLTMLPAMFMTALCVTFICYAPMGSYVEGMGLPIHYSEFVGVAAMAICTAFFMKWKRGVAIQSSVTFSLIAVSLLTLTSCHDENDNIVPAGGDQYQGPTTDMDLGPETDGFNSDSFTLALETPDGTIIEREGNHMRLNSRSHLNLSTGLADGIYRLLYLEYPITDNPDLKDLADQFPTTQFGLGSRVEVKNGTITVLDHYDEELGLPGRGTADEPYEISSYNSLIKLAQIINSEEKNRLITKDTHFRQTGKIDLYQASREVDRRYGWMPIGANSALPFRGHYHGGQLSTMIVDRPNSAAVGLFGYVHNAAIYDVKLSNSAVSGNFGAGGVAGVSLMSGTDRGLVTMIGCDVSGCEITGSDQSVAVGALLGAVDIQSRACFQNCTSTDNTIQGTYNAGGIVGGSGLYSSVSFNSCRNTSSVESQYSGAGGLIGTCDTVQAAASSNAGRIKAATAYQPADTKNSGIGAGGLVGGTGTATVTSCSNTGSVSGYAGVGGLVGSARVKGSDTDAYMYNNVMFRYSYNEGEVSGTDCVGGLTGEAQCGTYAAYNKGHVKGTRYVGGIAGATSIAVTHNAINLGKIEGADYVAGIVGKTTFGSLALDHNYGEVIGTGSHLGGITALAGNNTIIHYCGNYGDLKSTGNGPVGGIVGEIGDPREWTAMNTTECIIGGMECAMGIIGPVMAIAGEAIEALSETLEVVLHITEVTTDCGLLISDTALFGIGVAEMIEGEEVEELSSSLSQAVNEINADVKNQMAQLRRIATFKLDDFDQQGLKETAPALVDDLLGYYESENGAEQFNEQINITREEREGYLERVHETNEIIHTVVSGVCIVVGAAATIGGMVVTGGAAAPFIVAGAAASLAGGLNAITKTCMEFQENAVIISQCINAGKISSANGSATGGLVGILQDNSILRDCLNTGDGPGHGFPFVGKAGNNAPQQRLLSVCNYNSWAEYDEVSFSKGKVVFCENAGKPIIDKVWGRAEVKVLVSHQEVLDPSQYATIDGDWRIDGTTHGWKRATSSNNSFPIPNRSEMRKY